MLPSALFAAAHGLAGEDRAGSASILTEWFRAARPAEITNVAAAARASFSYSIWKDFFPRQDPIPDARLEMFDRADRLAIAALLSLHRNGYVRELALRHLASSSDDRVVPFLLLRADDIVPTLRDAAEHAILARLRPELAPAFARSLGIVELLAARVRGSGGPLVQRIRGFLAQPSLAHALVDASHDADRVVRRAAFALRLRNNERSEPVLREALADPDMHIRRFAARTIVSRATSPEEKRALLPLLEVARSPSARILALRGWRSLDPDDAHIEAALLDPNASVRYVARVMLAARSPERFGETRRRALSVLATPNAGARELVGALGALADVGLRSDVDTIEPHAHDPRARVRSEAQRTLASLRQ